MERATEEEGGRATRAEGRRKERKGKVSSRRDFFFETFFFSYYTAVRRRATGVSRRARLRGTPIGVRVRLGSREFHAAEAANATLQSLGPSFRLALCDPKSSPRGHPLRGASPARRVFRAFLCVEKRASPVSLFASARSNSCAWRSRRLTRLGGARKTANAEPDSAACEVWARIAGGGVGGAMRRWRRGGGGARRGGARAQSGATVHVSRSREKEGDAEGRGVGGDGRYGARRTNERRGSLCSHLLGRSAQERGRLSKHLRRPAPHGARGGRCGSTKRLARKDVRKRGRREGLPATREGRNGRPAPRRPTPRARSVRRGSRRSVAPRARFQSSRATPPRPRVVAFDDGRSRPAVVPRGFGPFFSSSPSSRLLHRTFFNPSILGSLAPRSPPARANQRRA